MYLLFFPHVTVPGAIDWAAAQLADLREGLSFRDAQINDTHGATVGVGGLLAGYAPAGNLLPDTQRLGNITWHDSPFGWRLGLPPGGLDWSTLLLPKPYGGEWVTLTNGQAVLAPVPRLLPHRCGLDTQGDWTFLPRADLLDFTQACQAAQQWFVRGDIPVSECLDLVARALAMNYRVNRALIGVGELIDTTDMAAIVRAITELDHLRELIEAKKKSLAHAL